MKLGFYPQLAWTGMEKNRKTYLPYILTCSGMVMIHYLIGFLSKNENVSKIQGGITLQTILGFGSGVIAVFALIFLFYTNSFLIRRRKKEFGLYNILGMGKRNLMRILLWESAAILVISLVFGLFFGILFSKLTELLLLKMMGSAVSFTFSIEFNSLISTVVLFFAIYTLIFLNTLRQIHVSKPIELLHSETVGERPPKSNWFLALLGIIVLAAAYYIAVTIQEPISALVWFFAAVIMVIIASYLLFIAGSVVLCKILQKNKKYYYQSSHFVSISSMMYRMKRNGAGLATICILSTMVLVMLSSTVCLFVGSESSLRGRYPRDVATETYTLDEAQAMQVHQITDSIVKNHNLQQKDILNYRYLTLSSVLEGDKVILDPNLMNNASLSDVGAMRQVFVLSLEEYNRLAGAKETLEKDEILLYNTKVEYNHNTLTLHDSVKKIKKKVPKFLDNGLDAVKIYPSLFIVVPDIEAQRALFQSTAKKYQERQVQTEYEYYGFNLSCDDEEQTAIRNEIAMGIRKLQAADENFARVAVESLAVNRADFYGVNGGLLFLGILLGIVFILAAVLIMYYKQISEGYEDQNRFEIMQKVGMTKREIKKSINSQVLTVFFLPLIVAAIHITFAFPMISKLLLLFGLFNTKLLILVTIISFFIFALFYVFVYVITSRAYYDIVSSVR